MTIETAFTVGICAKRIDPRRGSQSSFGSTSILARDGGLSNSDAMSSQIVKKGVTLMLNSKVLCERMMYSTG